MVTPALQLAVDLGFAGVRLRVFGAARSVFMIALEPARVAVLVILLNIRLNERFQRVFGMRFVMTLAFRSSAANRQQSFFYQRQPKPPYLIHADMRHRRQLCRIDKNVHCLETPLFAETGSFFRAPLKFRKKSPTCNPMSA